MWVLVSNAMLQRVTLIVSLALMGMPLGNHEVQAPAPPPSPSDDWVPEAPIAIPAPPPPPVARTHWVLAKVTAYCPCEICCPGTDGHTSTRVDVAEEPYGIAADPRLLPYGSMLRIPGYLDLSYPGRFWPVDDTGSAMRHDARRGITHIDIRFKSHATAQRYGVRWMRIEVLDTP